MTAACTDCRPGGPQRVFYAPQTEPGFIFGNALQLPHRQVKISEGTYRVFVKPTFNS